MKGGDAKVIDIALKYGYETPESFTKAFTRYHGVSPMHSRSEERFGCIKGGGKWKKMFWNGCSKKTLPR